MVKFSKIKYLSGQTMLNWKVGTGDEIDSYSIDSGQEPRDAFKKALRELKPKLIEICEVETLPEDQIRVTGLSLKRKGEQERLCVVITGLRTLKCSGGVQPLNSPQIDVERGPDPAAEPLDKKTEKAIFKVISEAESYIAGKKLQKDLFDKDETEETEVRTEESDA